MNRFLHVGISFLLFLTCNLSAKQNTLEYSLALVGMSMDYKEYDPSATLLDSEKSNTTDITGYEMRFTFLPEADEDSYNSLELNVMMLSGDSQYVGSLLHSGLPYGSYLSTTKNTFIDTDIMLKHLERYSDNWAFVFGIGLGYHSWNRALSSSQQELYSWYSLRPMVGVHINEAQFDMGVEFEYQKGFNSTMTSSNPALDFTLGGADVYQLSIPVTFTINQNLDIFVSVTFSRQEIKKSNNVASGSYVYYEPDSTSYQNYAKFGMTFKF